MYIRFGWLGFIILEYAGSTIDRYRFFCRSENLYLVWERYEFVVGQCFLEKGVFGEYGYFVFSYREVLGFGVVEVGRQVLGGLW